MKVFAEGLRIEKDVAAGSNHLKLPLIVDLDGTFLRVDTLYELFAAGLFAKPVQRITAVISLKNGIAGGSATINHELTSTLDRLI